MVRATLLASVYDVTTGRDTLSHICWLLACGSCKEPGLRPAALQSHDEGLTSRPGPGSVGVPGASRVLTGNAGHHPVAGVPQGQGLMLVPGPNISFIGWLLLLFNVSPDNLWGQSSFHVRQAGSESQLESH